MQEKVQEEEVEVEGEEGAPPPAQQGRPLGTLGKLCLHTEVHGPRALWWVTASHNCAVSQLWYSFWKNKSSYFQEIANMWLKDLQVLKNLRHFNNNYVSPTLGRHIVFALSVCPSIRLSVYPSGCLSVCHTSFPLNNSSTLWPRAFKLHRVIALIE